MAVFQLASTAARSALFNMMEKEALTALFIKPVGDVTGGLSSSYNTDYDNTL